MSTTESAIRRRARTRGYVLRKSRARNLHYDNQGKYMLIRADGNWLVLGERFDASLEDIARYVDQ